MAAPQASGKKTKRSTRPVKIDEVVDDKIKFHVVNLKSLTYLQFKKKLSI